MALAFLLSSILTFTVLTRLNLALAVSLPHQHPLLSPSASSPSHPPPCRHLPGDAEWPTHVEWARLNDTLQGRLHTTKPLASACHGLDYNATECQFLREQWDFPLIQ